MFTDGCVLSEPTYQKEERGGMWFCLGHEMQSCFNIETNFEIVAKYYCNLLRG